MKFLSRITVASAAIAAMLGTGPAMAEDKLTAVHAFPPFLVYTKTFLAMVADINERVYETVNNGVYKAGFATSQDAYDDAVHPLFDSLAWLERLLENNRFLAGDKLTEADWRLFTTLARFDLVYHTHFKCNHKRLIDYPNLWAYTRQLYQHPDIAETVHFDHIVRHYHFSQTTVNPHQIIPINPTVDFTAPHGRD